MPNLPVSRTSLFDEFFRDMAPGFFVRPLHGDPLPQQILSSPQTREKNQDKSRGDKNQHDQPNWKTEPDRKRSQQDRLSIEKNRRRLEQNQYAKRGQAGDGAVGPNEPETAAAVGGLPRADFLGEYPFGVSAGRRALLAIKARHAHDQQGQMAHCHRDSERL